MGKNLAMKQQEKRSRLYGACRAHSYHDSRNVRQKLSHVDVSVVLLYVVFSGTMSSITITMYLVLLLCVVFKPAVILLFDVLFRYIVSVLTFIYWFSVIFYLIFNKIYFLSVQLSCYLIFLFQC